MWFTVTVYAFHSIILLCCKTNKQFKPDFVMNTSPYMILFKCTVYGGRVVGRRPFGQGYRGSKPPAALSKLRQFRSPHFA